MLTFHVNFPGSLGPPLFGAAMERNPHIPKAAPGEPREGTSLPCRTPPGFSEVGLPSVPLSHPLGLAEWPPLPLADTSFLCELSQANNKAVP